MSYVNFNRALTRAEIEALTNATNGKIYFAKDGGIYVGKPDGTAEEKADLIKIKPEIKNEQLFNFRQTGGGLTKNDKNARVVSYKGKTLAWNQLMRNPTMQNSHESWYISSDWNIISETDSEIKLGQLSGAVGAGTFSYTKKGHKYLYSFRIKIENAGGSETPEYNSVFYIGAPVPMPASATLGEYCVMKGIVEANDDNVSIGFSFYPAINITATIDKTYGVYVYDLTLMFGSGNEPTTVEEFESLFPESYYPYNAGTLISNEAKEIESVGFNQWDEEWEVGTIDPGTGQPSTYANNLRSKNFIDVIGNTEYYYKTPSNSIIYYYSIDKNYINYDVMSYSGLFTTPQNCAYIKFAYTTGGVPYANNVCINLSDTSKNSTYEPYHKFTLPLNLNSFKVKDYQGNVTTITGGLKSAGNVYDEISGGKYIKRIGEVDLGTLDWVYDQSSQNMLSSIPSDGVLTGELLNLLCSRYNTRSASDIYLGTVDKAVGCYNSTLRIRDTAYSDAESFKEAMYEVMLFYELANEEIYELAEPLRTDYIVDKLGTERVIAESPICPFRADIHYYESSVKDIEIENMPQYLKREELTDELDKLQDIESGAQVNTIEHIKINDTEQTISNKTVNLPAYPTSLPASDVYDWAKASTKPGYNFSEIGGSVANSQLPSSISIENITASGQLSGNAFKVIAEHIAKLTARVEVLEAGVGTLDTLTSNSIDSANGYYINGDKTVIIGSGAPTMIPAFAGQFYINTSGPALYYAVNNSATTDWKQA